MDEKAEEAREGTRGAPHVVTGQEIATDVVRRVTERVLSRVDAPRGVRLEELVHETVYAERKRLSSTEADDPRAERDRAFVAWLRRELAFGGSERQRELVARIVERYTDEISGHFDPRVHALATAVLPPALDLAFRGFVPHGGAATRTLDDRVLVRGEVGSLRALARVGTVILAPTHTSNLDAVILGSALHRLGIPPFAYGAGLNLFTGAWVGFFMRNLGAYTIDRKKHDPLYLETVKEYTTLLLEHGQHCLFFPGGTRSRSGAIESRLKLGLLGTAPVAFRHALEAGATHPRIFVVPCTITYPLVLEASTLVDDFLRAEGGAHFVDVRDEFEHPRRWLEFLHGLLQLDLHVHVRIGAPLDPMGNAVDDEGTSHDPRGRVIDAARYLYEGGRLAEDAARDAEYTRVLGARLIGSYRRDTVALPTSVLAYVVFERLRRARRQPDLFRLLRSLEPSADVPLAVVQKDLATALEELARGKHGGRFETALGAEAPTPEGVLEAALRTFATYHATKVVERRGDMIHVGDPHLLFYYRNRLEGYGLLGAAPLLTREPVMHLAPAPLIETTHRDGRGAMS